MWVHTDDAARFGYSVMNSTNGEGTDDGRRMEWNIQADPGHPGKHLALCNPPFRPPSPIHTAQHSCLPRWYSAAPLPAAPSCHSPAVIQHCVTARFHSLSCCRARLALGLLHVQVNINSFINTAAMNQGSEFDIDDDHQALNYTKVKMREILAQIAADRENRGLPPGAHVSTG